MPITRALGALTGFLLFIGGIAATAAADPGESIDITRSRSTYLLLADRTAAPEKVRPQHRRLHLRYDQTVQVGGNDYVLRFKAPLKKKRLLAFEVLF